MEFSRRSTILITLIATTIFVVKCQRDTVHDSASTAASRLTKHKARELAANPSALIHEALHLVRGRRSVDVRYDDQVNGNYHDRFASLARKRRLEEKSSGEEREHSIDKRQIPDGLGMLNDYMNVDTSPVRLQQAMVGLPNEQRVHKRTSKNIKERVSESKNVLLVTNGMYASGKKKKRNSQTHSLIIH